MRKTMLYQALTEKFKYSSHTIVLSVFSILEKRLIVGNSSGTRYMILICKLGDLNKGTGLIQLSTPMVLVDNIIKQQLIWGYYNFR